MAEWLHGRQRLFVLTGAGISTACGIPDYRDDEGGWKRRQPITLQQFHSSPSMRCRYWARSHAGWPVIARARPGATHHHLRDAERCGRLQMLVTQNVDGLHQAAGHRTVIDLHGRLDTVVCLACDSRWPRQQLQAWLDARFPVAAGTRAPDGDADLASVPADFRVPDCPRCGSLLKPDVVFFGENVPRDRVDTAMSALHASDGLLVVGSSLMVWSGYRFVLAARRMGIDCAAINLGRTRADDLLDIKLREDCNHALEALTRLGAWPSPGRS